MMKRMFLPWYNIDFVYKSSSLYRELQSQYNVLVNFKENVLGKNSKEDLSDKEIFVKQILDENNDLSEQEILDEMIIFLIAVRINFHT